MPVMRIYLRRDFINLVEIRTLGAVEFFLEVAIIFAYRSAAFYDGGFDEDYGFNDL